MKKRCVDKVSVFSARVDCGTNKVKKAHTSVVLVREKSSLEKDICSGESILGILGKM